jgi:hypothetical protein
MSWGVKWIDPRQSQEPLQAARLYPDLVRAGSLANALDQELARVGSLFRASPSFAGLHQSWSYAEVMSGDRTARINCRAEKRKFRLDLSEDAISMARGTTRELSELAAAVELLLNSTDKVSDLVREIRFMKLEERALRYENGTHIEDRWQDILAGPFDRAGDEIFHWDGLAELIRQAAERPELRRLLPFTSLHRFSVTRRRQLPEKTIPMIWPLGNGQYRLTPDSGPPFVVKGDASVVLDTLVEHIRSAAPRAPGQL